MYAFVLALHSAVRWFVLVAAVVVIVRAVGALRRDRAWDAGDKRWISTSIGLLDLQFVLGAVLYVLLSPLVRSGWSDLGAAMASRVLRFFTVEHVFGMVVVVALAHVGRVKVKRAASDRARHRRVLGFTIAWLAIAALSIPWPGLGHGRPLVRSPFPAEDGPAHGEVPASYAQRCAVCHGAAGRGDGIAAGSMSPPPRDFTDAAWQRSVTDAELRAVIAGGGPARNLSANMPPAADLSDAELDALIAFIRQLGGEQGGQPGVP